MDNGVNIHLSESMIDAIRARGGGISAGEITDGLKHWNGLLSAGEQELAQTFTADELARLTRAIAEQAREDRTTFREFWNMSTKKLGHIAELKEENLGERCLRLGELAGLALKSRVSGVIVFPPGTGGRPRKK